MGILEIILIALSLSADAWSVATCKGISSSTKTFKNAIKISIIFGTFQMLMPLLGFYLGNSFFILFIIGLRMIIDSKNKEILNSKIDIKELIILGIATSIDAFAVGLTFSLEQISIIIPILIIGLITFILSLLGYLLGNKIGLKLKDKAMLIAGIILIILSIKYLLKL